MTLSNIARQVTHLKSNDDARGMTRGVFLESAKTKLFTHGHERNEKHVRVILHIHWMRLSMHVAHANKLL